jgi:hypothetical protein
MVASRNGGETDAVRPSAHWHVSPKTAEESFFEDVSILRWDGLAVAVAVHNGNITPEEVVKTATLIAAAPALLEALRPFAECAEQDIGEAETDADTFRNSTYNRAAKITVGHLRRARAAIARATGDAS